MRTSLQDRPKSNNEDLLSLHEMLVSSLPNTTHCGYTKTDKSNYKDTLFALHDGIFIRFNTQKAVNMLVFDDDDSNIKDLDEYHRYITETVGIEPTYTIQTSVPGKYQFAFFLNRIFWTIDFAGAKNDNKIKNIKRAITSRINGDFSGSVRTVGVWRNPLNHSLVFSGKKYSVEKLEAIARFCLNPERGLVSSTVSPSVNTKEDDNFFFIDNMATHFDGAPIPTVGSINISSGKMVMSKGTTIQKHIDRGFVEGNRNNFIFASGFKLVFEDRSKLKDIVSEMTKLNNSFNVKPLTDYEIGKICKSITDIAPTMYTPRKKEHGKLFNEMQSKGIHGVYNRQAYAGFTTAKKRTEATVLKVIDTMVSLFEKGKSNYSNREVAKGAEISERHYYNIKNKLDNAGFNKSDIFMAWINGLSVREIVIRVYFIHSNNLEYKGVNCRLEKEDNDEKTSRIVKKELKQYELSQMAA